jgi:hypothetical protein
LGLPDLVLSRWRRLLLEVTEQEGENEEESSDDDEKDILVDKALYLCN